MAALLLLLLRRPSTVLHELVFAFHVHLWYDLHMGPVRLVERLEACDVDAASASELPGLFHTLRQLTGWAATVEARLARRAVELEATGEGAPAADVISRGTKTSPRQAHRAERRGATLADAPELERQLAAGRISTEHADALANAAAKLDDDDQRAALFERQVELARHAASETPAQFSRTVRRVVDRLSVAGGLERSERQRMAAGLTYGMNDETGMGWIRAELHPDDFQRVARRLDAEVATLRQRPEHEGMRHDQLAARAGVDLICGGRATSTPPAEVLVLIDHETITTGLHERSIIEYADGTPMPVATARRHACNANIIPVVLDSHGMPLDVGRGARHATPAQRRALRSMYRTCAVGDCDRGFDRCEIHHLLEWDRRGGPTDMENLVPVCSYHHHRAHEGRWRLQLDSSTRQLSVFLPDGSLHSRSLPDLLAERSAA
jgi:hypothetical protein